MESKMNAVDDAEADMTAAFGAEWGISEHWDKREGV
jgi:hypothetical protein